jgi:molybdate transport system substrate-binding protein
VLVAPPQWERLRREGRLVATMKAVVAKVGMGLAVAKGAARPDVRSVNELKRTLLNAQSIAVGDPEDGSPSGAYARMLFARLGIAADVRPKLKLVRSPAQPTALVAKGEAEVGLSQIGVIASEPGVDLAGPLPAGVQSYTIFKAGTTTSAREPAAARALVEFLSSARARAVFKASGLEPGN